MGAGCAWVLNFDVERELEDPRASLARSRHAPSSANLAKRLGGLLGPADTTVDLDSPRGAARGRSGRCWCPTPRALACLDRAGAVLPAAPPMAVLQLVNHRRFCASLGQTLPGAVFAESMDQVESVVAAPGPTGRWLVKRPFGFAGRGRLEVDAGDLAAAARAFCRASVERGEGIQIEPLVPRTADFSLHGHVDGEGLLVAGEPVVQTVSSRGVWLESRPATPGELSPEEAHSLRDELGRAGRALAAVGYFGPFGIDAFRWGAEPGGWVPRCEINARYSMSWALGMGDRRPDAPW